MDCGIQLFISAPNQRLIHDSSSTEASVDQVKVNALLTDHNIHYGSSLYLQVVRLHFFSECEGHIYDGQKDHQIPIVHKIVIS